MHEKHKYNNRNHYYFKEVDEIWIYRFISGLISLK